MLIFRLLLMVFILSLSESAEAICIGGIGDCDPKNYDECVLKNLKGIESKHVMVSILKACRSQFPLKKLIEGVDYDIWWVHNEINNSVDIWIKNKSRKQISYVDLSGYKECGGRSVPDEKGTNNNDIEGRYVPVGGSLMLDSIKPAQDILPTFNLPDYCLLANVYWGEYE